MISTRLAPATLALLLAALVPTVLHTYAGVVHDDGVRVESVPAVLLGMSSEAEPHNAAWGRRRFGTDEWIDRWYGTDPRVRLTVVRTLDPKTVFHHPELAISYPQANLGPARRERLRGGEPVFVLRGRDGSEDLVAYALLSDGHTVENPYLFQVGLSFRMLVGGRRPMTLVYVQDPSPSAAELDSQPAIRMLAAALDALRRPASER